MNHIDIDENLLPISEVPKILPPRTGGRRLHLSTVFRWMKCENFPYIRIGGTRYTTRKAIAAWSRARAARGDTSHTHLSRTPDRMARRSVAQARALLRSPEPRSETVSGVSGVSGTQSPTKKQS